MIFGSLRCCRINVDVGYRIHIAPHVAIAILYVVVVSAVAIMHDSRRRHQRNDWRRQHHRLGVIGMIIVCILGIIRIITVFLITFMCSAS